MLVAQVAFHLLSPVLMYCTQDHWGVVSNHKQQTLLQKLQGLWETALQSRKFKLKLLGFPDPKTTHTSSEE